MHCDTGGDWSRRARGGHGGVSRPCGGGQPGTAEGVHGSISKGATPPPPAPETAAAEVVDSTTRKTGGTREQRSSRSRIPTSL